MMLISQRGSNVEIDVAGVILLVHEGDGVEDRADQAEEDDQERGDTAQHLFRRPCSG